MFKVISNRLEQGHKTSRYPQEAIELHHRFRGLPEIDAACDVARHSPLPTADDLHNHLFCE